MSSESHSVAGPQFPAIGIVILMLTVSLSQIHWTSFADERVVEQTSEQPWSPYEQPWSQYGGTPTRNGSMPTHDAQTGTMLTIDDPVINWVALDDDIGSDAYGSIIGNFSESLTTTPGATQRCAPFGLFAVVLHESTSTSSTKLSLFSGDDADLAWQVDLGDTKAARSTPVLADVDLGWCVRNHCKL